MKFHENQDTTTEIRYCLFK